jgi:hypothetical protein
MTRRLNKKKRAIDVNKEEAAGQPEEQKGE